MSIFAWSSVVLLTTDGPFAETKEAAFRFVGRFPQRAVSFIGICNVIHVEVHKMAAIRYLINDVDRAIHFYTQQLGFKLDQQMGPAFAYVSREDLTLWLSGPQSSAARPMPDGRRPEPGGWNRLVLKVDDLPSVVATMKQAGIRFWNEIVTGPGGKQILLEDPDGNPIAI
jgi:catechol 2,3-dioxygenase-like lactoylglutathione lyase family enzyme